MSNYFKDTISLMCTGYIRTKDFYLDLLSKPGLLECTDAANLPKNHPCYVTEKKKVPGLFSDETDGKTITEFCALLS
ncbi:Hypothetical protein CINCED_3A016501 [Cinara cedri]|nr:Hypothetical protein CINCED_3A016501 [Cinara cedri]